MTQESHRPSSPYSQPIDARSESSPGEETGRSPAVGAQAGTPASGSDVTTLVPRMPTPAIDLIENTDELWVFIDLPGYQPEEINLRADARTLHVRASRPSEIEEGRNVLSHERMTEVERSIPLPVTIDIENVDVIYEHGVCKMTAPKAANEQYHSIDIRTPE